MKREYVVFWRLAPIAGKEVSTKVQHDAVEYKPDTDNLNRIIERDASFILNQIEESLYKKLRREAREIIIINISRL